MSEFTVIKQNHLGEEVFRWNARLLERTDTHVVLEARFGLSGHFMGDIPLEVGDRFVETYYADRWYNVYEVHSQADDRIKCWYCNIAYPALISANELSFRDLALDLLVYANGRQLLLDEDEFDALDILPELREKALKGLAMLQQEFATRFM
jgi:hypothetical protein